MPLLRTLPWGIFIHLVGVVKRLHRLASVGLAARAASHVLQVGKTSGCPSLCQLPGDGYSRDLCGMVQFAQQWDKGGSWGRPGVSQAGLGSRKRLRGPIPMRCKHGEPVGNVLEGPRGPQLAQPKRQQNARKLEVAGAGHGTLVSIQAGNLICAVARLGRGPSPPPGFHLCERRILKYGQGVLQ